MKVGLFIPCYIDQFYPKVGIATLNILKKLGCEVEYPMEQTCCGQPMANSGFEANTQKTMHHFVDVFSDYDYIVAPSGSCALHVKEHYPDSLNNNVSRVKNNIYELSEFLTDVLKVKEWPGTFNHKIGLHSSCHGLRGLRLAKSSELNIPDFNKTQYLLNLIDGVDLIPLERSDECCGFGGTFAVAEEALSVRMGNDRISDHEKHGAEIITAGDSSCLMHMEGLIKRQKKNIRVMHFAEILNESLS
ncbi:Fe-S oxidoreductase [Owenweeksia hongkongensis DSM 17368]|uniref:Fe-S oxidoreductase n=1 Tax=Owenweeksia hongkongensis (strain DSM 17368 / CIP 108786 / JCM 12287 / NRRL B-23963 / UST20020801) TaxID=926562 RepID=G8R317_OWEHD|nr:(Fe-S)-binding protein [Owenweeksia hongkongensis]AEV33011.1 Fe-S oxidoreductase [Owenweeksia hongkongensis DSM 17368]